MFLRSLNRISAPLFASAANPTRINVNAVSGKLLRASYATKDIKISWDDSPYKTHKCDPPPTSAVTNKEELLRFYKDMYLMRRIELLSDQLYKSQLIRGFLHLYTGQEAVCVGMEAALTHKDHIITAYRDHTIYLGRGGTSAAMLAELLGRANGCAKGKGGSMHMYKADTNFYGGNGIVGAQVPVGTGIAMAQQYLNTGNVCVTMFGDGAANQGQVFEAFNMAALWKLPVIYVVENNHYAMGTSTQRSYSGQEYYTRGDYIPGIKVDGMDVLAVKSAFQYSVDFVKSKGPILLEMNTYRYAGHSMSDPGTTYRSRAEIDKVRESRDPLNKTKDRLLKYQLATEEEILAIEKEVKEVLNQAVAEAKAGPEPDLKETYTEVYIEPTVIRGVELSNSYHP